MDKIEPIAGAGPPPETRNAGEAAVSAGISGFLDVPGRIVPQAEGTPAVNVQAAFADAGKGEPERGKKNFPPAYARQAARNSRKPSHKLIEFVARAAARDNVLTAVGA
jgi:hypothetical protein